LSQVRKAPRCLVSCSRCSVSPLSSLFFPKQTFSTRARSSGLHPVSSHAHTPTTTNTTHTQLAGSRDRLKCHRKVRVRVREREHPLFLPNGGDSQGQRQTHRTDSLVHPSALCCARHPLLCPSVSSKRKKMNKRAVDRWVAPAHQLNTTDPKKKKKKKVKDQKRTPSPSELSVDLLTLLSASRLVTWTRRTAGLEDGRLALLAFYVWFFCLSTFPGLPSFHCSF